MSERLSAVGQSIDDDPQHADVQPEADKALDPERADVSNEQESLLSGERTRLSNRFRSLWELGKEGLLKDDDIECLGEDAPAELKNFVAEMRHSLTALMTQERVPGTSSGRYSSVQEPQQSVEPYGPGTMWGKHPSEWKNNR